MRIDEREGGLGLGGGHLWRPSVQPVDVGVYLPQCSAGTNRHRGVPDVMQQGARSGIWGRIWTACGCIFEADVTRWHCYKRFQGVFRAGSQQSLCTSVYCALPVSVVGVSG